MPAFLTGASAVGIVSGAFQTEVYRGAYLAIAKGELEAARAVGMHRFTMLRRIIAPIIAELSGAGTLPRLWHL